MRQALAAVDEHDHALADYVADICIHFADGGRAERIAEHDDQTYDTLASLVAEVDSADPSRSFLVRQQLGNYALWLSGFFPDRIELRRWRRGAPGIEYYDALGRKGFALAAEHRLANAHGLRSVFEQAAERFVKLRVALNRVSDTLLFPDRSSPERLMRQVSDEARWRRAS